MENHASALINSAQGPVPGTREYAFCLDVAQSHLLPALEKAGARAVNTAVILAPKLPEPERIDLISRLEAATGGSREHVTLLVGCLSNRGVVAALFWMGLSEAELVGHTAFPFC